MIMKPFFAFFFLLIACQPSTLQAQLLISTISTDVTSISNNKYHYSYTISVNMSSDVPVDSFSLQVADTANLSNISSSTDWEVFYVNGSPGINWSSFDPFSYTPINPGGSATFSFDSTLPPTNGTFSISGATELGGIPLINQGSILAPNVSAVPEPSSLALCSTFASIAGVTYYLQRWISRQYLD